MIAELLSAAALWTAPAAPAVTIVDAGCPAQPTWACYIGGDVRTVYVPPELIGGREFVREHELGHGYDDLELVDGERRAIAAALDWRAWHKERFADFYAGCRLHTDPRAAGRVYGPFLNLQRIARRCSMIARAGR